MKLLDTNLILRFLLQDHPTQSPAVKKLLESNTEIFLVTDVIIAEIVWVLSSFYKLTKDEIGEKVYQFLNINSINSNKDILIRVLYLYRNQNLSFIDAYLAAYCEEEKLEGIYSFDEGLDKVKSIKRFKP